MDEKMSRRNRVSRSRHPHSGRSQRNNNNNKKNRSKFKTILLSILGLVLFGTVAFAGYTIYNFSSSAKKGYKETDFLKEVDPNFKKFSILILGIDENDQRKAEGQTRQDSRTDSIILA